MKDNTRSKIQELGEFGLIDALAEKITTRKGTVLGIGDDCAILETIQTPVVTLDTLVEGVHFRFDWIIERSSPRALGWKSMAVSVSDLAASGAWPVAAFVSLAMPKNMDLAIMKGIYEGFEQCAETYGFTIAGGDTVESRDLNISVTLIGNAFTKPILRSGAQIGDIVSVSGNLGDSAGGLFVLLNRVKPKSANLKFLLQRHFEPTPRLEMMKKTREIYGDKIHAAVDISDGISSDAQHIARRSNVAIEIDWNSLPISEASRGLADKYRFPPQEWAIWGGEDYELLICSSEPVEGWIPIGKVVERNEATDKNVTFFRDGEEVEAGMGWRHF